MCRAESVPDDNIGRRHFHNNFLIAQIMGSCAVGDQTGWYRVIDVTVRQIVKRKQLTQ